MSAYGLWLLAALFISIPGFASDLARFPRGLSLNPDDTIDYFPARLNCFNKLTTVDQMLEDNDFDLYKSLLQYKEHLGDDFWTVLKALRSHHVWFDSGAGAFVALGEYLTGKSLSPFDARPVPRGHWWHRPQTVGLVYRLPPEAEVFFKAIQDAGQWGRLKIVQDQMIESIEASKIGPVNLLTDVMGPFSYTDRIDLVLNKYFELVPVGGHIFILTGTLRTKVMTSEGEIYLSRYLKKVLKGHEFNANFRMNTDPNLFHIKVTEQGPKVLPRVKLRQPMKIDQPPERHFIEDL